MKKLVLITLLFLITPYAKADMDYICSPEDANDMREMSEHIAQNCERNNILSIRLLKEFFVMDRVARWCRHDREINYNEMMKIQGETHYHLVCVLYDNKPRTVIPN